MSKRPLKALRGYQKQAIHRMINEDKLNIFIDMGLGKTIIALVSIKRLLETNKIRRALIVAPLSVVYNVWEQEAKKWEYTPDLTFTKLHGPAKNALFTAQTDIHLINYEGLLWLSSELLKRGLKNNPYDLILFDESTKMKSVDTQRFKRFKGKIGSFKRRYIATGSPTPGGLHELWAQCYLTDLGERLGSSYYTFLTNYFVKDRITHRWNPKRGAVQLVAKAISDITIRLAAKDYLDLPSIVFNDYRINMNDEFQKIYDEFEVNFELALEGEEILTPMNVNSLGMKLRQFVQGGVYNSEQKWSKIHTLKNKALCNIIEEIATPVLVAYQFTGELEALKKDFPKAPIIRGGMNPKEVQRIVKEWNAGKHKVIFCHPQPMSQGLNLQAGGRHIIWLGLPWSLEHYDQLNKRLHRMGQKKTVVITHVLLNNTKDENVVRVLKQKHRTQEDLLKAIAESKWHKKLKKPELQKSLA